MPPDAPWDRQSPGLRDGGFMRKTSEVRNERWSMRGLVKRIKEIKGRDLSGVMVIGIDFGTT